MLSGALTALKALAARLVFFLALIVLLPLAVLNRQLVDVTLNPMALLREEPVATLTMPLFIALFALFALGILLGYALAAGRREAKTKPPLAAQTKTENAFSVKSPMGQTSPPASGGGTQPVLKAKPTEQSDKPADNGNCE